MLKVTWIENTQKKMQRGKSILGELYIAVMVLQIDRKRAVPFVEVQGEKLKWA